MAEPPYLNVRDLSKRYDQKVLFEKISFSLHPGDKVALVARNGTGKSTLIKALAGSEPLDSGEVLFSKQIQVGFVFQNPQLPPELSVRQAVLRSDNPALKAIGAYEQAQQAGNTTALEKAFAEMERLHAWDTQQELERILNELRLDQLQQPVGQLSGGQKRRIDLARALLEAPDLLILDEPTNHLDLDMIEWLENRLTRSRQSLLMVTHDRYFLEAVCNRILELDQGQLYQYPGNFSVYLEQKAQRAEETQRQREADLNLYRKELAWVRKQPRARGTKSRARVEAFEALEDKLSGPDSSSQLQIELQMQRLGGKILELEHLQKAFGQQCIVKDFSHVFNPGDRIGMIGRNGTGKSTFLNLITGLETPDSGRIDWGETVRTVYYRQQTTTLPPKARMIEVVRDVAEYLPLKKGKVLTASQLLERFLFPPSMHFRQVGDLSGGEQRRLYLLTLLMQNPNFLILDEPTNDLDIETIQILEHFLLDYPGCLLVVSHDRYLMDKLVDHLLIFEGQGQIRYYPRSYSDYWLNESEQQAAAKATLAPQVPEKREKQPKKLSWKEERELENLEQAMEQLPQTLAELEAQLADPEQLNPEQLQTLSSRYGDLQAELESTEMRWLELAEKQEALKQN